MARIATFGILALSYGLAAVLLFYPRSGSFWGESFFDLPYMLALWFGHIVCGLLASVSAYAVLRHTECSKNHIRLGIAVATMTYLGYGLIHTIILMFINSIYFGVVFFGSFIMFGGLVFFPVSAIFAIAASALGYRLFCTNKSPQSDA